MGKQRVVIIGAGIIGLSVGTCLLETYGREQLEITIIAERFTPDTTSDKSGGQILPYIPASGKVDPGLQENILRWTAATVRYLQQLSQDAATAGAIHLAKVAGYRLFETKAPLPFWRNVVVDFKEMDEKEIAGLKVKVSRKYKYGWLYHTFMLECPSYLPWLMEKFRRNGGLIVQKRVSNLREFDDYDVIINCTGLGARDLVGDTSVYPIRGQILGVTGVSLDGIYESDKDKDPAMIYIFPWKDEILLGGTADANDWSTEPDPRTTREIYARCTAAVPKLTEGKVVRTWAGLRPMRSTVRLELEKQERGPAVVHCYGHGGQGVTLHWGCALDVTKLVETALHLTPKAKL